MITQIGNFGFYLEKKLTIKFQKKAQNLERLKKNKK